MLTMFIRAFVLYVMVVVIIRVMGKRQIGQLQPYELVFTLIVADLVASPMGDVGIPLFYTIMPVGALVLCYALMSILCLKSERVRAWLTGRPSVLVRNGVIDQSEMKRQSFSLSELMERVRESGLCNLHEVGCAVLEVNGEMSVFPVSQKRPVQPQDMGLQTSYEGLPLNVVLDGRIQTDTLTLAGLNETWLKKQLGGLGLEPQEVFFCAVDTDGMMSVQKMKDDKLSLVKVLEEGQVCW